MISRLNLRVLQLGLVTLFALPNLAQAHPGHDSSGMVAGLAHPLTGLDHLLAMVAVGLWAVQLGGRALWMVPGTFVGLMAAGGALGMAGVQVPLLEQGILASVFALGLLLITALRLPLWASMGLAANFALLHGLAHGSELPAGATGISYGCGMLLSTVVLHLVGIGAGSGLRSMASQAWLRMAGVGVMAGGALLLLS